MSCASSTLHLRFCVVPVPLLEKAYRMQPAQSAPAKPATAARIYDYMLGGVHNFAADREVAETIIKQIPGARAAARANRAFLGRGTRFLAEAGIRQYLDIGSGIPTQNSVHEILATAAPGARCVYVDLDIVAVSESLEILGGSQTATAIRGDMRDPDAILSHPKVTALLDFDQPVGLLMAAVLHFLPEEEQAHAVVGRLLSALPAGSYLLVSHVAMEMVVHDGKAVEDAYRRQTATPGHGRRHDEVRRFFTGLELVDPGLVWVSQWRPDPDVPDPFADDPRASGCWVGVARKP
jgi:hypothetical protein